MKIYYNLTRIENGWLLNYPKYSSDALVSLGIIESYYETLKDVLGFIEIHFQESSLGKQKNRDD